MATPVDLGASSIMLVIEWGAVARPDGNSCTVVLAKRVFEGNDGEADVGGEEDDRRRTMAACEDDGGV